MEHEWILEADEKYEVLNNIHDKGYKYLLEIKRMFVQLMRSFVTQKWVQKLDENTVERIDRSFISESFKNKESDLVYKVRLDDREVFFYILLELQSTVDFQMPYRLLQYMLEIWRTILLDTEKKKAKRKEFRLPVIVPCVLYNGKNNWTVCRSFRETLEGNEQFGEYVLDFKYILFDVKRYDEKKLIELANVIGAAFFMDQNSEAQEIVVGLKKIGKLMSGLGQEDFEVLRTWVRNILARSLPKESAVQVEELMDKKEAAESMIYAIDEAIMKEKLKARREGRKEGKIEGKIEDILDLLNQVGSISERLKEHIQSQEDIEILSTWLKLASRVESIEEFMGKINMN